MQVIAKRTLREFCKRRPRAEAALDEWHALASKADWATPDDVKAAWGSGVDFVGDNRAVFDIRSNEFRLVVHIAYRYRRVLIKFVGSHRDYDRIRDIEGIGR